MSKDNENKNVEASSQKAEAASTANPMKSVQTMPLPTKMAYFSEQGTKKNDDSKRAIWNFKN